MTDVFHKSTRYADMEGWRDEVVELHGSSPVHLVEAPGFQPFHVVIGHEAILDVERQPELFTNEPLPVLLNDEAIRIREEQGSQIKSLIHMDDPEHQEYRSLTNDWFKPARIRRMSDRLDELSRDALTKLAELDGSCDFCEAVAIPYPLQVILRLLGLPEEDYPRMLTLTQQLFANEDPELRRSGEKPDPEAVAKVVADFYKYFTEITENRKANPGDDLATVIANGDIGGEPMPFTQQMGYYIIIATAGHDTTSASMAEGILRFAQHPEQLRLLQEQPDLLNNAVAETIRLATPVRHFMREAQEDTEVAGVPIAKGDWVMLNYTAGNLDPSVFDDPTRFDITRENADRHIAFGFGVHFCLGAQLARMELRSLFGHLLPQLETLELDGDPAYVQSTFVSGLKHLPIRYTLR